MRAALHSMIFWREAPSRVQPGPGPARAGSLEPGVARVRGEPVGPGRVPQPAGRSGPGQIRLASDHQASPPYIFRGGGFGTQRNSEPGDRGPVRTAPGFDHRAPPSPMAWSDPHHGTLRVRVGPSPSLTPSPKLRARERKGGWG
jgi:hypothetical protein